MNRRPRQLWHKSIIVEFRRDRPSHDPFQSINHLPKPYQLWTL